MKFYRLIVSGICLNILMFGLQGHNFLSNEGEEDKVIVVIVNKENPVADLKPGQAKLYYLRKIKRRWPNINKSIKPVDLKGSNATKSAFLGKVLGMDQEEVSQYFTQRQFANSEAPPVRLSGESEVIKFVSENVGGIGFVSLEVYNASQDQVKAVLKL